MKLMRKKTISTQIQKNRRDTEKKLRDYAFLQEEKLLSTLSASKTGLSTEEALERQNEYGANVITAGNKDTTLHRLREAVINPFNVILLVIAAVNYFTDVIASKKFYINGFPHPHGINQCSIQIKNHSFLFL